ncbi:MAG TPA: sulfite exporter TauE/SafE family protein [Candidatus Hydrogenedentes bacterium]|nr:sulfite exporter TauE/SafE family protein [Candidatus Hydrogenedentota bacterium]
MLSNYILPGVSPVVFWLFVSAAVIIQGVSKSGFAGGAGVLSLPLMMLVMPVDKVAATLLPLLILLDINAIYHHRRNKDWRVIRRIYIPSIVGIVLGALAWWYIGSAGIETYGGYIKRFVGVMAIFLAFYILAKEASLEWVRGKKAGVGIGWGAGIFAGFSSTIAHAAGPIVSLYVFSQDMGKTLFVGTVAWTFTLINLTKLPFYVAVDLIDFSVLRFDALLIPLVPVGSWLGKWMHYRVSESLFNRIIMTLTLLAGVQLLFNINLVKTALELLRP